LRADIQPLIACAHSLGFCTNLDTNGALLTQARVRGLKAAGLDIIGVSLDSPVADRHDALRRMRGLFARAVNGIRYCLDTGIHCYVSTYASHENVADGSIRTLIDLAKQLGVGWIRVCAPFAAGKWIAAPGKRLTPDERRVVERIAEDDPDFVVLEDLNGCPGVQRRLLYISAYGEVQPCCYVPIGFGNIRTDRLKDIVERIDDHPMYARYGQLKHCPMNDDAFRSEFISPSLPILQETP
jgi:MoaA/NifB/PqqE/SkfB family radical SAM enzyme